MSTNPTLTTDARTPRGVEPDAQDRVASRAPVPAPPAAPSARQLEKLRTLVSDMPLSDPTLRWLGARATHHGRVPDVRAIVPNEAWQRAAFDAGASSLAKKTERGGISEALAVALDRAIADLGRPGKSRPPRPPALEGVEIVRIERRVADRRDGGLLSLTLRHEGREVTLRDFEGRHLAQWPRVWGSAAEHGLLLPNNEGAASAWRALLSQHDDPVAARVVAPTETLSGRVRMAIANIVEHCEASEALGDLLGGRAVLVTRLFAAESGLLVPVERLFDEVKSRLTDEQDLTRADVAEGARMLGGERRQIEIDRGAPRVWCWAFPAAMHRGPVSRRADANNAQVHAAEEGTTEVGAQPNEVEAERADDPVPF